MKPIRTNSGFRTARRFQRPGLWFSRKARSTLHWMPRPISGNGDDEYVELYNKGTNTVNLAKWKFTSGIAFTFPSNTFIAPDGYLVVARNKTNLLAHYPGVLNVTNTVGDFGGSLAG